MRRPEIGLGIAAGLLLVLLLFIAPGGLGTFIRRYVAEIAVGFWYVGAAAIVVAFILRSRRLLPRAAKILAFIGIAWITFVTGAYALLFVLLLAAGPIGP